MSNKKCVSLIVVVFCMMSLVAFAGNFCSAAALPATDSKATVVNAYAKLRNLKSYHAAITLSADLSLQGGNMNNITTSECDIQVKPMLGKNTMSVTTNLPLEKIEQQIVQYYEESGKQSIVYSKVNNQWVKQIIPNYTPLKEYDHYSEAITSVTPISEDANSITFEVIVNGSSLSSSIEKYLNQFNKQKMNLNAEIIKGIGNYKYKITVDKKTAAISQINMDLTDIISKIGGKLVESKDTPEGQKKIIKDIFDNMKVNMNITFSQFNNVPKILIPSEVKNAISYDLLRAQPSAGLPQSK